MKEILANIPAAQCGPAEWMAKCPACGEGYTLTIESAAGVVFVRCSSGCLPAEIMYKAKLHISDLFHSWTYWKAMTFLGLVELARKAGIRISKQDREAEKQAFISTARARKAEQEKRERQKNGEG